MSENPYRAAREMIESSCPSDVKAQIHEVIEGWRNSIPITDEEHKRLLLRSDEMHRSIERQARAWAFWRGVLWGAIFAGAGVWYLLKGLVGG